MPSTKLVYRIDQVVSMLPYIRSFCRSLKRRSQESVKLLINDPRMSPEEVKDRKDLNLQHKHDLQVEISSMKMCSCSDSCGFVDVPMIHPHKGMLVMACVGEDTMSESDLKVHLPGKRFEERRSVWKML